MLRVRSGIAALSAQSLFGREECARQHPHSKLSNGPRLQIHGRMLDIATQLAYCIWYASASATVFVRCGTDCKATHRERALQLAARSERSRSKIGRGWPADGPDCRRSGP